MASDKHNAHTVERTLVVLALVLMMFLSPLTEFWASLNAPWYSPYLVWLLAILLVFLLQRYLSKHEV